MLVFVLVSNLFWVCVEFSELVVKLLLCSYSSSVWFLLFRGWWVV